MAKLGGEYRKTGGRDRAQWDARCIFLRRIEALAPDVLNALRRDVLAVYEKALAATSPRPEEKPAATDLGHSVKITRAPNWFLWSWQNGDWDTSAETHPPALRALTQSIREWATRHRLEDHWFWTS